MMGRLLAPYGVKGWVKVRPYSALPDALLDYKTWHLSRHLPDGGDAVASRADVAASDWTEFRVVAAKPHADTLVAELDGVTTREEAMAWRGALVGIPRRKLPKTKAGEYYLSELLGLTVINRSAQVLGRVEGLLESGAHPVLRVTGDDGRERLIPLVPAFLDAIEADNGRIVVDWQLDY